MSRQGITCIIEINGALRDGQVFRKEDFVKKIDEDGGRGCGKVASSCFYVPRGEGVLRLPVIRKNN